MNTINRQVMELTLLIAVSHFSMLRVDVFDDLSFSRVGAEALFLIDDCEGAVVISLPCCTVKSTIIRSSDLLNSLTICFKLPKRLLYEVQKPLAKSGFMNMADTMKKQNTIVSCRILFVRRRISGLPGRTQGFFLNG